MLVEILVQKIESFVCGLLPMIAQPATFVCMSCILDRGAREGHHSVTSHLLNGPLSISAASFVPSAMLLCSPVATGTDRCLRLPVGSLT